MVNSLHNQVLPYDRILDYSEGMAVVGDMVNGEYLYGYVDVKGNQNKNQDVSDNDEEIEEDGEGKSTEDTTENLDNEMEIPEEWNE